MKFDDAVQIIDGMPMLSGSFGISPNVVKKIVEDLREEYAPTVEMTEEQRDLIFKTKDDDKLYEIMADEDGYYFDACYWEELRPNQVASAYLHPESIKAIDNEE